VLCVAAALGLLWALYQLRLRQVARQFNIRLEERVSERTRIARDLHDTLLQSFHGLLLRFQTVSNLLPAGEPKQKLESAIDRAAQAITEGRDAVQGLRSSTIETNDLALALNTLGEELAAMKATRILPSFVWQWKARRRTSIRSCGTKSTGSRAKRCAMPSGTPRRTESKWRSGMTNGSFGCGAR